MLDRQIAPEYQQINEINIIEPSKHYLANGIPVHVISAGKQPVINMEILFPKVNSGDVKDGAAFFTTKMLTEGTTKYTATEISNIIDNYGAHIGLNPGLDFISVEFLGLKKYFQPLLALLYELMTEATFPEKDLKNYKNIKRQSIRLNNEKNSIKATKEFRKVLFGANHPYGKSLEEDTIDEITREDLRQFYERYFGQFEIIVAGQVDQEALQLIDKYFGQKPFGAPTSFNVSREFKNNPSEEAFQNPYLIEKSSSVQSSVRAGRCLFKKSHQDYQNLKVVNTILGGYFGSRLMSNLREEKGLTYGVNSSIVDLVNTTYLIIGTDVKKSLTRQTLDEINFEMDRLKKEPVGEEELGMVKNYMAGKLLASIDTPFAQVEKFKEVYLFGLDIQFYNDLLHTINTITPDLIMEMANKYFEELKHVIVGGWE